ncbi:MAG: hypothetical protein IKZ22_05365, partial [Kiritimatiellae bacterium]|nr:hypothetical protein [Kiritimatiellia bacterium]
AGTGDFASTRNSHTPSPNGIMVPANFHVPAFSHAMRGDIPQDAPNAASVKTAEKNIVAIGLKDIADFLMS